MSYNITGIGSNSTGLLSFIQGVNTHLMFGWLGIMLLIGISVILFMSFMITMGEIKRVIVATTFLTFVIAVFFKMMSLIPNSAMFICLILAAGAVAFSFMGANE